MATDREDDSYGFGPGAFNGPGGPGTGDAGRQKSGGFGAFGLSDMMKKAAFAAIGAAFMTEESVRGYVAESKLPRDAAKYLIQNASQAKEQFFGYLAKEITGLVKKSDLPRVASEFLKDHTIEVEAKIRFRANGSPEVQFGGIQLAPGPSGAPARAEATPAHGPSASPGAGGAAAPTPPLGADGSAS